jgi:hypothetical protein
MTGLGAGQAGARAIRWSTITAVSIVALVAAFVSYRHALQVVRVHGESGPLALAYPLTVDGLIYSASMVLLNAARQGIRAPRLAYLALGLGIAATLAANVAAGLRFGTVGALVAAWPAVALVISYELLMLVIRGSAVPADQTAEAAGLAGELAAAMAVWSAGLRIPLAAPEPAPVVPAVPEPPAGLNGYGHQAAEVFAADVAEGRVPGIRPIKSALGVGQDTAQQVQAYLRTLIPA